MEKKELVNLVVTRERVKELHAEKIDKIDKDRLVKGLLLMRAKDIFSLTRLLISQVGKEKAIELIEKDRFDVSTKAGREAAEKAGNPKDIDSYIEINNIDFLGNIPGAPIMEMIERSEKRYVFRNNDCYWAEAVRAAGAEDPETLEVVKCWCSHDTPWAHAFNPDMKFERTHFVLDGDDYCEFRAELKS